MSMWKQLILFECYHWWSNAWNNYNWGKILRNDFKLSAMMVPF